MEQDLLLVSAVLPVHSSDDFCDVTRFVLFVGLRVSVGDAGGQVQIVTDEQLENFRDEVHREIVVSLHEVGQMQDFLQNLWGWEKELCLLVKKCDICASNLLVDSKFIQLDAPGEARGCRTSF